MGSSLSPIMADLALQDLESYTLSKLPFSFLFYVRHVDNITLVAPHNSLDVILQEFNSFHTRLKFTMKVGGKELNFLELKIINKDGEMIFDWYHKPTFSGRLLNFHSLLREHLITHKKGVVINLIDKVLNFSHPDFQHKNFSLMINLLLDNAYPLDFIFALIRKRLMIKFQQFNYQEFLVNNRNNNSNNYFVMPYIGRALEKFVWFFKNIHNFHLTFYGINKSNSIIKVHKDILPTLSHSNVVYKIRCLRYNASYVGQTRRLLTIIGYREKWLG